MKQFRFSLILPMLLLQGSLVLAQIAKPDTASREHASGTATMVQQGQVGMDSAGYVIGADDSLQITVWKEPSLSGTFPVRPDGMISLVLIGDIRAANRTPMQLSSDIEARLKKFVQDPNVTVIVAAANSHRIFVVGEVQHVGAVPLSAGMSPLQAIAAAGGLTPYANQKHIYILRGSGGKQKKIAFNYKNALKGDEQGITLVAGDTIVVP